ncbi:MAG: 1-deoxy-D-xylulose-5-phosphate reductoisomerase [Candidatus Tectomicrobia bacterium]|nr:1-deoxy-D-xylulose-5-phosphate reductoisomerase [Candidatus Tectomicrobia bacterium]
MAATPRRAIAVLGSTGSIGTSTLNVIRDHPDRFTVVGLTAGSNDELLERQVAEFGPRLVALRDPEAAERLRRRLPPASVEILAGVEGITKVAVMPEAEQVMAAIVGAAGLLPTLAALEAKKTVAFANKETLVMAGELMAGASADPSRIIPVDSEHSAIFQCLAGEQRSSIRRILLTASGGPFLDRPPEKFASVTPAEALRHPNWTMGAKITVDSATLMNKGLEVIEARWLFGVSLEQIDVLIHRQSIVHSLVEFHDGAVIAQLGIADMRVPIAYALSYPQRLPNRLPSLDLAALQTLTFEPPDVEKFPCLRLAYEAARLGGTMPTVLNAANEVAVGAFLEQRLPFSEIPKSIEKTMAAHTAKPVTDLETVLAADAWARRVTASLVS